MAEAEIIDRAVLDSLLKMTGNDPAFLAELLDTYFEDSRQLLATMRRAVDGGDAPALARAAHSLKSNSANVGAMRLAAECRGLEEMARGGALHGMAARVEQAADAYDEAERALRAARPGG